MHQLLFRQLDQIRVGRIPEPVVLETEILEAVTGLVRIRHHLGRPGTEVLDAADLHARIVDVDPVVIEHVPFLQNQHDGEEVAILQTVGGLLRALGNRRRNAAHQFAHRRRRNHVLGLERLCVRPC